MSALGALRGAAVAALAAGCGWHVGPLAPAGAPHARSVGVEVFSNSGPEPDVEAAIQEALSRAVLDVTGLELAACDRADLIVRGTLGDYRRRGGVHGDDNELLETGLRLDLGASLLDRESGVVLRSGAFKVESGYAIDAPGDEREALERDLRRAAERIALELFAPAAAAPEPAADRTGTAAVDPDPNP
jgi:hypothetical protein